MLLLICLITKQYSQNPIVTELFSGGKNKAFLLPLSRNSILQFRKILKQFLETILLWKLQTQKSFNISQLIIHQILSLKILWSYTKNVLQSHILFWGNDTTLASDNPLRFRYNLLERTWKSDHKADDKIRDEKLRYNINREAARLLDAIIRYRCL